MLKVWILIAPFFTESVDNAVCLKIFFVQT